MKIIREYTARFLGSGKRNVQGICLHDTAGSGKINDVKYLANPGDGREVSVDFCVTREGDVYQLNPDLANRFCFHAGRHTKFRDSFNASNNRALLGIEIVQKADLSLSPLYPDVQVKAVADLCKYLCNEFNLSADDITTHAKIITDGSRSDPRKFPFELFWTFFEGDEDIQTSAVPQYHTVVAGDTLSALAVKYSTKIEAIKALNGINEASNLIKIGQSLKVK